MRRQGVALLCAAQICVAQLCVPAPSSAAVETWRWKSGGPTGAPIRDVVVDPVHPGHLWAITASGILESGDEGTRWRTISAGLANPYGSCWVTCLAVDPAGERLVAGTRLSGLFASTDRGRSWETLPAAFEMSVETIPAVSIDPRDPQKILAGTNAGLFVSDDGGASFRRAAIPNTRDVPGNVLLLERDGDDPDRVFVSVERAGLFSSADGGLTWSPAGDGLLNAPGCLAFEAGHPSRLWAGGVDGLHRWDALTARWVPVGSGLARDVEITSLCLLPAGPGGGLFAGTRRGRVFRSLDGGDTWEPLGDAPPQPGPAILRARPGGGLYLAGGGGLFVSTDARTWSAIDAGLAAAPLRSLTLLDDSFGHLVAASGIGIYRSDDFGDTWSRGNTGLKSGQFGVNHVSSDPARPARLCAATEAGLVLSDDAGGTWRSTPLSGWVSDVRPLSRPGAMLAAVLQNDETVLYATEDDGAVWQERLRAPRDAGAWLSADADGDIFLFARGLYRSDDGGRSWAGVTMPAGVGNFTSIAAFGLGSGRLIAGTDDGLYESIDRGLTWTGLALSRRRIVDVEIHRLDTGWIAALCDDGLDLSLDGGRTWSPVPLDGVAGTPTGLALDPSRDFLYLTDANAVYISAIPRQARQPEPERLRAYPNPFSVASQISFELKEAGSGDVTLFSVGGDRVRQFVFTAARPGVQDLIWDGLDDEGRRLPNGMYIVVVRTARETCRGKLIKIG